MTIRRPLAHSPRRRRAALTAAALLVLATVAGLGISTVAWATTMQDEGRMLPGTTISDVDVGGSTRAKAVAQIEAHVAPRLDRPITITSGDESWETTARDLGAETDIEAVVEQAQRHTSEAGPTALARVRWSSDGAGPAFTAEFSLPSATAERLVDDIADSTDREAREAEVTWNGSAVEVTGHEPGLSVDRGTAVEVVRSAIARGDTDIEVPSRPRTPSITTDVAERIAAAVGTGLSRVITLQHQESSWDVTARDLGGTPDLEALIGAARTGESLPDATFSLQDEPLADRLDEIGSELRVPARDAQVAFAGGEPRITPERLGIALDHDAATRVLAAAVNGQDEVVALPTTTVQPSVTASSLDERMLVVDLAARRVHLYRGGRSIRSWEVAVGSGDSPTPTGIYTVGARRYEPTWHNPAPNRWGEDMPASIGPGPDNPLGARALNWTQDGRDTLIRFHGTPNEASIGRAASKGCIRMRNPDVIELYDLVPSGTPIVSIAG